jgi:predicted DsbA family dithiol-disulfide isomerase
MALENEHIGSAIIEANEFPDLITKYGVDAVPKIVINERIEMLGAQPEGVFVAKVVESVKEPTPQGL